MTSLTAYEVMININLRLINGEIITSEEKESVVKLLLSAKITTEQALRFYIGVRYPNNNINGNQMYPIFYIPPYNKGKKFQTVIPMSPKTHILSANSYELEIIRLLYLFAPENEEIKSMVNETLKRLKTTCFGYKECFTGECFHTALIVLRFLIAVRPIELDWINKQIDLYNNHFTDTRRHSGVKKYFELCLIEKGNNLEIL